MSPCQWSHFGGYSCTWICFNIYLSIIYFIWCMMRYTMRWTRVPPNVTSSTKLWGAKHCFGLAFRTMDFCVLENLIITALLGHVQLQKKLAWPTNKLALRVCYKFFCTNLGDGISCTLSPNHNIHWEKWCLSAMDNVCFEVIRCVRNAFSSDMVIQFTDLGNSKKTQSLGKKPL